MNNKLMLNDMVVSDDTLGGSMGINAMDTEVVDSDMGVDAMDGEVMDGDMGADMMDGDMGIIGDTGYMYDDMYIGADGMGTEIGVDGMDTGSGSSFKPMASWLFIIGLSVVALAAGVTLGILLAKRKIKKGLDLYED